MNRRSMLALLCGSSVPSWTQLPTVIDPRDLPPPPGEKDFRLSSDVDLVLLDVSVKKKDGGFASDLDKSRFTIFENNKRQEITSFNAGDIPVTVGLVVDNSASVRRKRAEIVTAALTFVQQSNPQDEVFVVNFNDTVLMGLPPNVPFTGDRNLLREALLTNPAQGRTALYDGIRTGLDHLEKGRLDKKTLIVISDGGDNASDVTHDEILRMAALSAATIYTVGIYDEEAKDKNPGFLRELSSVTGGEAFLPKENEKLVSVCEKIAKDVRNRYTLGYAPVDTAYDGKVRRLRVVASAPAGETLRVRTRTHYIAAPRSAWRSRKKQ